MASRHAYDRGRWVLHRRSDCSEVLQGALDDGHPRLPPCDPVLHERVDIHRDRGLPREQVLARPALGIPPRAVRPQLDDRAPVERRPRNRERGDHRRSVVRELLRQSGYFRDAVQASRFSDPLVYRMLREALQVVGTDRAIGGEFDS